MGSNLHVSAFKQEASGRKPTDRSASTLLKEAVPRKDSTTVLSFQAMRAFVSSRRSHNCTTNIQNNARI